MSGSGAFGDVFKMAMKMVPAIVDEVQKGTGMCNKDAKMMTKMTMMKMKPILAGMTQKTKTGLSGGNFADIFKSFANAVITPLKLISNIGKAQSGEGKRKKKLLKKMEDKVAKALAKSMLRVQKGKGVSFGDVLSGIATTASEILPFIL
jgi:hypothetical protein